MAFEKKVTEKIFTAVKILLESGAPVKEICKYFNLSNQTVYVLKNCESYQDYMQYVAEKTAKSNAARAIKSKRAKEAAKKAESQTEATAKEEQPVTQIVEHRQTVQITATHYMMEELKKQNELLTIISNKLAYIVEQLA